MAKKEKSKEKKKTPLRHRISHFFHHRQKGRSLRSYVFIATFLMGLVPCLFIRWFILTNYENRLVNVQTSEAQTQLRVLANHLLTYNYLDNPEDNADSEVVESELEQFASFFDGRVLIIDDGLQVVNDTYEMSTGKTIVSSDVVSCLAQGSDAASSRYVKEDHYIEVIMPISQIEVSDDSDDTEGTEEVYGVLLSSVSTNSISATMDSVGRRTNMAMLIVGLVVFSLAVLISSYIARPIEQLAKAFRDVQSGYTSESVQVNAYRETQESVDAFNQVIGRMRSLDESRQDFVSNVSHELKTPMTSMKVLADSLLQMKGEVSNEMYREFLEDIDEELDRANNTIDDLLTLSKMDRKQVKLNLTQVDINALVESILKEIRPLAQERDIALVLVSEREVKADIDKVKMSMVFSNLIENAVKYNVEHGKVTVTVDADQGNMIFICEDTGIGISKEAQGRIFERFYRGDQSRSSEVGGTGLGLSIAKSVVLLHHGTIEVESTQGKGSRFTVRVPLSQGRRTEEWKPSLASTLKPISMRKESQEIQETKGEHTKS